MSDIVNISLIIFFGGFALFYALFIVTNYEAPASFEASMRRASTLAVNAVVAFAVGSYIWFGPPTTKWDWASIIALPFFAVTTLVIDWLILRRRKLRGNAI